VRNKKSERKDKNSHGRRHGNNRLYPLSQRVVIIAITGIKLSGNKGGDKPQAIYNKEQPFIFRRQVECAALQIINNEEYERNQEKITDR